MSELFDQVDEFDKPTGKLITRLEAHENNLIHRCAVIYVFTTDNGLYLQLHKKSDNRLDHSAGGHVESGETYLEAAKRELKEELGIETDLKEVTSSYLSRETKTTHMFGIYSCIAPVDWEFRPNSEVEKLKLMPVGEIKSLLAEHPEYFTSGFRNTFKLFAKAEFK